MGAFPKADLRMLHMPMSGLISFAMVQSNLCCVVYHEYQN